MVGPRIFLAALLLALPLWVALSTPAHACTCVSQSPGELAAGSDMIVIGVARDTRFVNPLPTPRPASPPGSPSLEFLRFDVVSTVFVEEYLKGSGPSSLDVQSHADGYRDEQGNVTISTGLSPSCGFALPEGERWLIFIDRTDAGRLETSACGGNVPIDGDPYALSLIAQVRQLLGGVTATATSHSPPTATVGALPTAGAGAEGAGGPPAWLVAGAVGAGALLAGTALFGFRRRAASRF